MPVFQLHLMIHPVSQEKTGFQETSENLVEPDNQWVILGHCNAPTHGEQSFSIKQTVSIKIPSFVTSHVPIIVLG